MLDDDELKLEDWLLELPESILSISANGIEVNATWADFTGNPTITFKVPFPEQICDFIPVTI